ncbi:MAG: sigma-54-dependent Fis family transcriptional regulator [Bacteroidetes bacterium RIFOXYA12_FULL_35_11]|nr:MAG: sigma-54-dependent Fis family transcriptional regulator [Bacteroidetes bacterium GWF2_35_48]OFY78585.1 MAG: sigma-54-dependent Fis family transcriptional regulator [Bacteroidetes bacterium RIFOXYA12_FULL_35_11]OFZ03937.1 MAG: sigma-54-dependent Fis family transcriptional regulator [Bacteroidetes bacterium RIFOXYC12_FULL_35_7]HBX52840.1 sigma-54-dependent Fis family transcriptional regulator [Bacteroidales bacterium]
MIASVLIIDDEDKLRNLLSRIIKSEGFDVSEASDCKTALKKVDVSHYDIILCDVKLPDGNGIDLIKQLKSKSKESEIILLTAYGNIPDGVQAIKNGAFDYIVKGDDNNKIIPLLHRASEKIHLLKRIETLENKVKEKYSFDGISCKSKIIKQAIEFAEKVANTNTSVLLTGETGTGKEVFAQSIHNESPFAKNNFVALNCSNFNKDVLESELFGYKQGAFTGAIKDKKGLLEEANNGTLFLDEIGDMPYELQAKLLRVIETNQFIKLGDTKTITANFRLIAATNKNLKKECEEQRFRSDLFYRISTFHIDIPPLRERKEDIEPLAEFFVKQFAEKTKKNINSINKAYLKKLSLYQWPGNIRELKNIIERSVILENSNELTVDTLPIDLTIINNGTNETSQLELAVIEKNHIIKVLNHAKGNKAETARLLNIAVTTLYRKLEEYKIE